jgi:hypothetical protein
MASDNGMASAHDALPRALRNGGIALSARSSMRKTKKQHRRCASSMARLA